MTLDVHLIRRIHHRLKRRHRATGAKGLLAVGLGWPRKNTRPDPERPRAIVYAVKKKLPEHKLKKAHIVPKAVPVFVTVGTGRNKRRRRIFYPTDVIEVGKTKLTGLYAKPTNSSDFFTVGALAAWGTPDQPLTYGILTVSHGVPNGRGTVVRITLRNGQKVNGTVLMATPPSAWLDAALIQLQPGFTPQTFAPLVLPPPGDPSMPALDISDLDADATYHDQGASLPTTGTIPIGLLAYFPTQQIIDAGTNLREILMVQGPNYAFQPGTSGSAWLVAPSAIGIQVAGTVATQFANGQVGQWVYGYAQPMCEYVKWAQNVVGEVPLQLIAVL